MKSQWFEYKERAVNLRKQGMPIREIEKLLGIPRSTLSGWFKAIKIELTEEQKIRLKHIAELNLIKARYLAGQWHRQQKKLRIQKAHNEALATLQQITTDRSVVELALAMLYLGEGAKNDATSISNSNPLILKFFIAVLTEYYGVDISRIKAELHLRADQNAAEMKKFWSKELDLPLSNFGAVVFDQRTAGRPTYPHYKGVCIIRVGNIAIQRKLISLYNLFCKKIIEERAVGAGASALR